MIYFNFKSNYLLITLFFGLYFYSFSQTPSREKLEIQKKQLENEISKINNLLFSNQKRKKSTLEELEDLNIKINIKKKLINVSNNQVNDLEKSIKANKNEIKKLGGLYIIATERMES